MFVQIKPSIGRIVTLKVTFTIREAHISSKKQNYFFLQTESSLQTGWSPSCITWGKTLDITCTYDVLNKHL